MRSMAVHRVSPADGAADQSSVTSLVSIRTACVADSRKLFQNLFDKKTCNYSVLKGLVDEKLTMNHPEVLTQALSGKFDIFEEHVQTLRDVPDAAGRWTQNSVEGEVAKVWQCMAALEALSAEFAIALEVLKKVRKHDVTEMAADERKMALRAREWLGKGMLVGQGLPKSLQPWLAETVCRAKSSDKTINGDLDVVINMRANDFDSKLDTPMLFQKTSEHEFRISLDLPSLGLQAAFERTSKAVSKHLQSNEGVPHNCARSTPKGVDADTFKSLKWMPKVLENNLLGPLTPCNLTSFGEPWVLHHRQWALRSGPGDLPLAGLGAVLSCSAGRFLVLTWPMQAVLDAGSDVRDVCTMLAGQTGQDAADFMMNHS